MATREIYLLSESSVKVEVKEEPVDKTEDYCWDSNAIAESSLALHQSIKEENDNDFDPVAACSGSASAATIKPELVTCSPEIVAQQTINISRKDIFLLLKGSLNKGSRNAISIIEEHISEKIGYAYNIPEQLNSAIRKLISDIKTKWQKARRTEDDFLKQNENWLTTCVSFEIQPRPIPTTSVNTGRRTDFENLSERSKRRRTENIRNQSSTTELAYALQMDLRSTGNTDAAKIVSDVALSDSSSTSARVYRSSLEFVPENQLSGDAAVSVLIEQKLSKSQYLGLRNLCVKNKCKLLPSYKTVHKAKKHCYPSKDDMIITESKAEVKLQALLNHTTKRILSINKEVIQNLDINETHEFILICKWGCDGTSGQSNYKQKFSDSSVSDSSIFFTSLVPLRLICTSGGSDKEFVIWENPRPSSPRYCRPIRIQFLHENVENTLNEVEYVKEQQKQLVPFKDFIDGKTISVYYQLCLTMMDGKVCNAISGTTSTQRCYICNATSKNFNDIDAILERDIKEENFEFGISSLHAWIRFFECCLHVSYKLHTQKYQARSEEQKTAVANRKKVIQEAFRLKLGLLVDQPKPGYGSTNDGNTARRFFASSDVSASITGVDEDLINRFHIILQALSCGFEINITRFEEFALATARKFVELYPWYYMPTTVHKILIHGSQIISSALLPIGQMSEEAQESCNKLIKRFREDFSRKYKRSKTMEDVICRLLVSSDPYITSIRKLPEKKLSSLSEKTIELLNPRDVADSIPNYSDIVTDDSSTTENYSSDSD